MGGDWHLSAVTLNFPSGFVEKGACPRMPAHSKNKEPASGGGSIPVNLRGQAPFSTYLLEKLVLLPKDASPLPSAHQQTFWPVCSKGTL